MSNFRNISINGKYDFRIFLVLLFSLSLFMICWFGPLSVYAGHDYYFNIGRFEMLIQTIKAGNYPIYIDYNTLEGYGYFTKGFYPDLVLFPFALLAILTGAGIAYNLMIFTMTFLCGLFMYNAVKVVFGNSFVSAISAILYTFSAYHLFDWYNRAALGESISFTFLPLVFLGLYHIIKGDYKKWYILTIGYSLLVYTHLLSSVLTCITLAIILILCYKPLIRQPKRIGYLFFAILVTIPIVGSYLFTMMEQMASNTFYYQMQENITGQTKLGLTELGWGVLSGILYPKSTNMAGLGPLLFCLILLRLFIREKTDFIKIADFCALIGIIYIIIISAIFPWGRLPLGFIQFPWRLYEFITFFFAIAGAYYLSVILRTKKQYIIAVFGVTVFTLVVFIVSNKNYNYWQRLAKNTAPEWFTGIPSVKNEYYLGRLEYLPIKLPSYNFIYDRGSSIESHSVDTHTSKLVNNDGVISFDVMVRNPDDLELPLVYYKGYTAKLNNKELPLRESDFGLVQIPANESGRVEVYYKGTTIQKISWYVTIISIVGFCAYVFFYGRRKNLKGGQDE